MAFSLDAIFTTVTDFSCLTERAPIAALKPYIRCFWFYERKAEKTDMRIISDCCADIVIDLKTGSAQLVGASDRCFMSDGVDGLFGIGFYAWAVSLFTGEDLSSLFNAADNAENYFKDFSRFKSDLLAADGNERRAELAQKYLLGLLDENYDPDIMNCLYKIITDNGNTTVSGLSERIAVSKRTLERKFLRNTGIAPKTVIDLIRYQLLWQDCIKSDFGVLDCVDKFGYYDQAHLSNDFKKYHGIGITEARNEYFKLSRFYNTINR